MNKKKFWSIIASIILMFLVVVALFFISNVIYTLPENKTDYGFWDWVFYAVNFKDGYGSSFISGTGMTLLVAIVGTVAGFIIGLIIAIIKTIPSHNVANKFINWLLNVYIEVFRGTPMMVQAILIYYGLMQAFNIDLSSLTAGLLVVSINTGAYMAEIVRGGIESIDKGQFDACHAIGMNHFKTMFHVILPQAIRNILPATGNEFVINIKDTSVLNVISVTELYFATKTVKGATYRTFEAFLIAGIIYLFLTFTITRILKLIEMKMDGSSNYALTSAEEVAD